MGSASSPTRAAQFRELVGQRPLAADGAMGTMLSAKGAPIHRCLDELNLSLPALVRDVHLEYVRAGAEILETNTFGANRKRLGVFGFANQVRQVNRAGVRIAREAAGKSAFVAGAMGPLGVRLEPFGPTTLAEAREAFREQAEALVEAGVDLLILETFRDLAEIREAIFAARGAAGQEVVIAAHLSVQDDGTLADGASIETFTRKLDEWPADVIGLNCSSGPRVILETIEKMASYTTKPLSAFPNAGLPVSREGRNVYLCSSEYLGQYARELLRAGVRILGGCCGTTPEHIARIRAEADAASPPPAPPQVAAKASAPPREFAKIPAASKSELGAKLAGGRFVAMIEIVPPKGIDLSREIEGARLAKRSGFDGVSVPDGPRASARLSPLAACHAIQQQAGMETVLHFSCRDRNILGIQSDLMGAHVLGVRNLICITGDPLSSKSYPDATAVFDIDAVGLVNLANHLNRGLDLGGNAIGSQTALLLGVGANPAALDLEEELRRFESKVRAGAEYTVTQPIFDIDSLEAFLKRVAPFHIPVIAGIWPLTSLRNAEFMIHELRVPIPQDYLDRMRKAPSAEAAAAEGIAIARELVERVRPLTAGVQISAPLGRYERAIEAAEAIGAREPDGSKR